MREPHTPLRGGAFPPRMADDAARRPEGAQERRPAGIAARVRDWLETSLAGFPEPAPLAQGPGQRVDVVGFAIQDPSARSRSALPQSCVDASSRFLSSLPASAPVPATRRIGASQLEFHWQLVGRRHLSVIVGDDGMLLYRAGFGAEGRIEGAEPDMALPSPILRYVCQRIFGPLDASLAAPGPGLERR